MDIRLNILFISLLIGFAFPCSCLEPPPPEEAYEEADAVSSGQVTNIVVDESGYYHEVTFQIIDVWKGEDSEEITVLTETYSDACGYNFQINNEYLVYAYTYAGGNYTNICTRTNLLEYASEDLDYLNQLSICDNGYTEFNNLCFHDGDIEILQELIDNSVNSGVGDDCDPYDSYCGSPNPYMDQEDAWFWIIVDGVYYQSGTGNGFQNANGQVDPLELGLQEWVDGRLTSLMCGAYIYCQLSGPIPEVIGNLSEVSVLRLEYNYLSGFIPETICALNTNNTDYLEFDLTGNNLCPPYPECIEDYVGYQDTSECEEPSLCDEETEVELWGECYNIEETTWIDLSYSGLTGEIPPEIGNLTNLTSLWLSYNQLTGEIPSEIGDLTNLEYLILEDNQLTGQIPSEIGNLEDLYDLVLRNNELSGEIPFEIWDLNNLRQLLLSDNQLTGEIPTEIGYLTNLINFNLWNNNISGEIPSEIGNLINLIKLDLGDNNLSGEIPPEIGNLIGLEFLFLQNNQLNGEIPTEIGNLINLMELSLDRNQLSGEIPISIGNLTLLENLWLDRNPLSGEIPSEIGNLTNLEGLYLNDNQLTGEIPSEICNQGDSSPSLTNNQLCPPYPECLSEWSIGEQDTSECEEPSICDNGYIEIDGYCFYENDIAVLQTFIDNSYASGIDLGCEDYPSPSCGSPNPYMDEYSMVTFNGEYINSLSSINNEIVEPLELGYQDWVNGRLISLMCGAFIYCGLSGEIPENISELTEIEVLRLEVNYFDGEIPESVCELENVNFDDYLSFDFSYNQLCPPYPDCIPDDAVEYMDTSECSYNGDINGDGMIDILDIIILVNMILDDEYNSIADLNEDGELNILDVVTIVNLVLFGDDNTCIDIDGNVYETVQIDEQLWMAENLKVTHYNNGDEITNLTSESDWTSTYSGAYSDYDNNPSNSETYGKLYNWYTVDDSRGLCMEGWHVPSDEEIMELEMFLGMSESEAHSTYWRGTDEGSKLAGNSDLWLLNGALVNNPEFGTSGFTALPAGYRYDTIGVYGHMGSYGYFWSSSELDSGNAWSRELDCDGSDVYRTSTSKLVGFSIRCLGD